MTLKKFKKMIDLWKAYEIKIEKAYDLQIDLIEFESERAEIIDLLLEEIYTNQGIDWITWFLFERSNNKEFQAWDENSNPICYDIKSLWAYVERNHRIK